MSKKAEGIVVEGGTIWRFRRKNDRPICKLPRTWLNNLRTGDEFHCQCGRKYFLNGFGQWQVLRPNEDASHRPA